jgi:AcrR family transcriptional regulator
MKTSSRRERTPKTTRDVLLKAAFAEVYRTGFQAASLEKILATAGVTKGALYHHFPGKTELGYAIIEEVLTGWVRTHWLQPMSKHQNPIDGIVAALNTGWGSGSSDEIKLGCPLNNLAQEMSPLDEGFRKRIDSVLTVWRGGIAASLARGQREGTVRDDIHPHRIASFIVASIEGIIGTAKNAQSHDVAKSNFEILAKFVETLRARARYSTARSLR